MNIIARESFEAHMLVMINGHGLSIESREQRLETRRREREEREVRSYWIYGKMPVHRAEERRSRLFAD